MKKSYMYVIMMAIIFMATGCSVNSPEVPLSTQNSLPVSEIEIVGTDYVDIDLSRMNALFAYSELSTMLANPNKYMGEIVKVKGLFMVYRNLEGKNYFSCYVSDDLGCCSEQIYFVESQQHCYPDDYPEANSIITVIGRFGSFDNCGMTYYGLVDTVFCMEN